MAGTILTVASGKGGVGKTTTAVNLAVALWQRDNAVALVDADLGMANVAPVLGLSPTVSLHDVLEGRVPLGRAIVEAMDGGLAVVPGGSDLTGFAHADPSKLGGVLDSLAEERDWVVVDTGAGLSYEDVLPLGLADEVLLVTTPEPAAIMDTKKTLELADLVDSRVRGIVVTRARPDTDADAVAADVGVDLIGTVPEDPAVTESTTSGSPLESIAPDAPATAAYREIASKIDGGDGVGTRGGSPKWEPADGAAGDDVSGTEPSPADDSAGDDDETAGDAADGAATDDESPARGGLLGWLGRRLG